MLVWVSRLSTVGESEKHALVTDISSLAHQLPQSSSFVPMLVTVEPEEMESLGFSHHALDRLRSPFRGMQADSTDGYVPAQKPLG